METLRDEITNAVHTTADLELICQAPLDPFSEWKLKRRISKDSDLTFENRLDNFNKLTRDIRQECQRKFKETENLFNRISEKLDKRKSSYRTIKTVDDVSLNDPPSDETNKLIERIFFNQFDEETGEVKQVYRQDLYDLKIIDIEKEMRKDLDDSIVSSLEEEIDLIQENHETALILKNTYENLFDQFKHVRRRAEELEERYNLTKGMARNKKLYEKARDLKEIVVGSQKYFREIQRVISDDKKRSLISQKLRGPGYKPNYTKYEITS